MKRDAAVTGAAGDEGPGRHSRTQRCAYTWALASANTPGSHVLRDPNSLFPDPLSPPPLSLNSPHSLLPSSPPPSPHFQLVLSVALLVIFYQTLFMHHSAFHLSSLSDCILQRERRSRLTVQIFISWDYHVVGTYRPEVCV